MRSGWAGAQRVLMGGILGSAMLGTVAAPLRLGAQGTPAATAPRQSGTVKAATEHDFVLTDASGQDRPVSVAPATKILIVPPGSKDLSSASPGTMADLQSGDRVLVTGKAGDSGPALTAVRVVVMKGAAIAQSKASDEAAWAAGAGGMVKSVDPATNAIVISSGARNVTISTTTNTIFRRYANGSVRFDDAVRSSLAAVTPGDQMRARGTRSADGSTLAADEVVAGSFRNYAGEIASIDASANTVTLKDLATKKPVTVALSTQTSVRRLPAEVAARFAARERAGSAGAGQGGQGSRAAGGVNGAPAGAPAATANGASAAATPSGAAPSPGDFARGPRSSAAGSGGGMVASGGMGGNGGMGGGTRGGGDLSAMISRLPTETLRGLKVGEAIMVVASSAEGAAGRATAITLLAGVEPILSAVPAGESMTLSPWSVGGGGEGEAGAGPQ